MTYLTHILFPFWQSSGLGERARVSKARSQALLEDAQRHKGKVTGELRNRLDNAITATDKVADVNKQTEDGLADLLIGMDMLPEGKLHISSFLQVKA